MTDKALRVCPEAKTSRALRAGLYGQVLNNPLKPFGTENPRLASSLSDLICCYETAQLSFWFLFGTTETIGAVYGNRFGFSLHDSITLCSDGRFIQPHWYDHEESTRGVRSSIDGTTWWPSPSSQTTTHQTSSQWSPASQWCPTRAPLKSSPRAPDFIKSPILPFSLWMNSDINTYQLTIMSKNPPINLLLDDEPEDQHGIGEDCLEKSGKASPILMKILH